MERLCSSLIPTIARLYANGEGFFDGTRFGKCHGLAHLDAYHGLARLEAFHGLARLEAFHGTPLRLAGAGYRRRRYAPRFGLTR